MGMLVKGMGADHVVWGTDAVWTGAPQWQIEALRRVAGNAVVKLIRRGPDETIAKIVSGWPRNFDPRRALDLGFKAEGSFEDIIRVHMEDELAPCK